MKKYLLIIFASLLILSACGSDDAVKEEKEVDTDEVEETEGIVENDELDVDETETEEVVEEVEIEVEESQKDETINVDEIKELLETGALGENDKLVDLSFDNGEINAIVEVGDNDLIEDKSILAESIYSFAGDIFLEHEGWEVLTIEFVDVGEVSMNRSEKEKNEYGGEYFPLEKIMEQLGNL